VFKILKTIELNQPLKVVFLFLQQTKKNNSMVEANLKIISELKFVLEEVANNVDLKLLFVDGPESFTRD